MTTLTPCPICGEDKQPFNPTGELLNRYIAPEDQVEGICQDCVNYIRKIVDDRLGQSPFEPAAPTE